MNKEPTTTEKCEVILREILTLAENTGREIRIGKSKFADTREMTWDEKVDRLYQSVMTGGIKEY